MSRALPIALLLMTVPLAAQAAPRGPVEGQGSAPAPYFELVAQRNGGGIGPGEAARAARAAYGGRVLAVHPVEGGAAYRVRLLVGGQVRVVLVDARSGRILR
ncbi:PepSY domain-containing protein [Acidihalobacter prosperus]